MCICKKINEQDRESCRPSLVSVHQEGAGNREKDELEEALEARQRKRDFSVRPFNLSRMKQSSSFPSPLETADLFIY